MAYSRKKLDLMGQRFGMLTVIAPPKRSASTPRGSAGVSAGERPW